MVLLLLGNYTVAELFSSSNVNDDIVFDKRL